MIRSWKQFCVLTATGLAWTHPATATTAPTVTALNAYAGFPASSEPVLLAATVTANGSPVASGSVTFTVADGSSALGSAVSGSVASGTALATFIVPGGTSPGSYMITVSYLPTDPTLGSGSDATHSLAVAQAPTLISTQGLAAGSAGCPQGGLAVNSGLDNGADGGTALDGILEPGEVLSTSNVCSGAPALFQASTLPVNNSICTNGGTQLDIGTDQAGTGMLESNEIASTVDICNGVNGTNGTNGLDGAAGKNSCASAPAGALALIGLFARKRRRSR